MEIVNRAKIAKTIRLRAHKIHTLQRTMVSLIMIYKGLSQQVMDGNALRTVTSNNAKVVQGFGLDRDSS